MAKVKLTIEADPTETLTPKRTTISLAQILAAFDLPLDAEVTLVNATEQRVMTDEDSFAVAFKVHAVRKPRAKKPKETA